MFRHFWTVVGVLLKDQFRAKPTANETKQKRKRRAVSTGLVYILIVVGFSPLLALIGYTIYSLGALRLGMYAETVAFLILVCQGVVLLFSFQSILRNVFMCADGHRLLCLPLTSATIFAAKLFDLMSWQKGYRYKMLGKPAVYKNEALYLFKLTDFELFINSGTRKQRSWLPEDWRECFGVPFERHDDLYKINLAEGYITTNKMGEMK